MESGTEFTAVEEHKNVEIKFCYRKLPKIRITFQYPNQRISKEYNRIETVYAPEASELKEVPAGTFEGWIWDEVQNSDGEVILEAQTEPTQNLTAINEAVGVLTGNNIKRITVESVWTN